MFIKFNGFDYAEGGVCAAEGFTAAGIRCGIDESGEKEDLALIRCSVPCSAAAVYTRTKERAAPVLVTEKHLKNGRAQAILCNSGNANALSENGVKTAEKMCSLAAGALGLKPEDVAVASTGVIGRELPLEPIRAGIAPLVKSLSPDGSRQAARAIMTTDARVKEAAVSFTLGDRVCKLGGIAKGSRMVRPDMGTLLCFLTTDAAIEPAWLSRALSQVCDATFNMIDVDGVTSPGDMVVLLASGLSDNAVIRRESKDYEVFVNALYAVMMNLSREIAADGEGAGRLLECVVAGAPDEETAKKAARAIASSPLLKTSLAEAKADRGDILAALAASGAAVSLKDAAIALSSEKGTLAPGVNGVFPGGEQAKAVLSEGEIRILADLDDGRFGATAWGSLPNVKHD